MSMNPLIIMNTPSHPASSSSALPPLPPLSQALQASSFANWYPTFRKVSPKATVIDVDEIEPHWLDWLEEDGLTLPLGSEGVEEAFASAHIESDEEEAEEEDDDDDEDEAGKRVPRRFMALDERIRQVLDKYDGRVFPKLNWSAPKDAAWMLPGSNLQCTTPADVYLLLKASDFVMKDIEQARELEHLRFNAASLASPGSEPAPSTPGVDKPPRPRLSLVLKKWFDMPPSHEFRCFVRAGKLIAISQRDSIFYEHMQPGEFQQRVKQKLTDFWLEHLQPKQASADSLLEGAANGKAEAPGGLNLSDYIFDAYLTRDMEKVFLVDINPYIPRTDPLLWDWQELEDFAAGKKVSEEYGDEIEEEEEGESSDNDSDSEEDSDEDEDPDFETVLRIYTDGSGRPPQAIRVPLSEEQKIQQERRKQAKLAASVRPKPKLRVIRSHIHAQQVDSGGGGRKAAPKYAHNMMPRDVLDATSNGESIAHFAKEWQESLTEAMK